MRLTEIPPDEAQYEGRGAQGVNVGSQIQQIRFQELASPAPGIGRLWESLLEPRALGVLFSAGQTQSCLQGCGSQDG